MHTTTKPRDLGERTFQFACEIVQFCRKLSAEPGVVRQIAWQLADAGTLNINTGEWNFLANVVIESREPEVLGLKTLSWTR